MNLINGIPEVIEGTAYYPSILVPNTKFEKHMFQINLAVSDEIWDMFRSQGFIGLHPAGKKGYTPDPVITFERFATRKDGVTKNQPPKLVDSDNEPIDVTVGNGSRVKVMWRHSQYAGGGGIINRAELVAVQVVELVEYSEAASADATDQAIASAEF